MRGISDLLDSDMENSVAYPDENSLLSSPSSASPNAQSNAKSSQVKRRKKRHPVSMPKAKSRITKASEEPPAKKPTKKSAGAKRKALEEQINEGISSKPYAKEDIEEDSRRFADEIDQTPAVVPKTKSTKPAAKKPKQEVDKEMEVDQTPVAVRSNHATSKTGKPQVGAKETTAGKPRAASKPLLPAPLPESMGELVDVGTEAEEMAEVVVRPTAKGKVRTETKLHHETTVRRRAGSASDSERGDPNLRRKLGDITRKFENVDLKYRNLKEIGLNEANANMEKLRKQCEATTQASNELVASLKGELAMQIPIASECRKLRKELQDQESEISQLRTNNADLSASLAAAQNEIKALQAKLAASRIASTSIESVNTKTPGSAMKNGGHPRTVMIGSAEAAQAAQVAQLKEDLYSDLTGLIIRSAKRSGEGDTFDCIQTGRNGTLHFKLYIDHEEAKAVSFEETEFLYTPLLDATRDREMIEMMPEYLTEEITFARQNAIKFYGRVVDSLTKRRADD